MQWRRKSAGRERVHIYLRQNGQPARVKMDTALHPSATQLTLWPAVQPHPLSCRSPHSGLSGTINYIFKKIERYFFGLGLSTCHLHFHIALPPAADRPVGRTRRPSKPRKSGRNPSCWCGGLLPTTGEVSHLLIECLGFVFGSVFFLL